MNEHRIHLSTSVTSRTVARRRRAYAARKRMAGMRARMAELHSATAMQNLAGPESALNAERTG